MHFWVRLVNYVPKWEGDSNFLLVLFDKISKSSTQENLFDSFKLILAFKLTFWIKILNVLLPLNGDTLNILTPEALFNFFFEFSIFQTQLLNLQNLHHFRQNDVIYVQSLISEFTKLSINGRRHFTSSSINCNFCITTPSKPLDVDFREISRVTTPSFC